MDAYKVVGLNHKFEACSEDFATFADAMAELAAIQADEWFVAAQVIHGARVLVEWERT